VDEIKELKRARLSIRAISRLTGYDRKKIGRFLLAPSGKPVYGPRAASPSKLEPFKPYLKERLQAGVWNAQVLFRELRKRNFSGGYSTLTEWLRPQRKEALVVAVRRFETPPGKQAQVDWGHLGSLSEEGVEHMRWGFTITLGYSRMMAEFNGEMRCWLAEVANRRVHGTTHEQVLLRFDEDMFFMQPIDGRPPYPYMDDEQRKVARDAYVSWQGSRYSVPWSYAGKDVWVRECGNSVEVRHGAERIAVHDRAMRRHLVITHALHHAGIPLNIKQSSGKTLIHIVENAPQVERRPLAVYDDLAAGGAR
jgi:hypothetical protein